MDRIKAQRILQKLNSLFDQAIKDNNISALEKDLLKNYTQQFYEALNTTPEITTPADDFHREPEKAVLSPETPTPIPTVIAKPEVKSPEPIEIPPIEKTVPVESTKVENHFSAASEREMQTHLKAEPASTTTSQATDAVTQIKAIDPEINALFEENQVTELSQKLSALPITDLTKAFGVNDRILTINTLFGGKAQTFNETLAKLNNLNSFQEAKAYLISDVAEPNSWSDDQKKERAVDFIKLVRRKFH